MATPNDRIPPHDLAAERSLLGAIIVDAERLLDAAEVVVPADFYRDAHRRLFSRILELAEDREPIDFVTLQSVLNRHNELEQVGGPAYIASLADGIPRGSNVASYAAIIRDKAILRRQIAVATKILESAYLDEEEATALQQKAEQLVFEMGAASKTSDGLRPMREIARDGFAQLERINESRTGGITGVPSGFNKLDHLTRGFQPSDLIVIAARPSIGKTSIVLNMASHMSRLGLRVAMFSLEMSKEQLFIRQLAAEARIDSHRMQGGYLRGHEWGPLSQAYSAIADWPMHVDDGSAMHTGVFEIRSRCRRMRLEHGLDVVMIDYLQLMTSKDKRQDNRVLELAAITGALKGLAKDLKVPVIILSQLSRGAEKRDNHRPQLHELRDSGAIEQDADLVLGLHRESYYNETDENRNTGEVIILKQRNGPIGTVELAWFPEETRFANFEELALPRGVSQPSLPDWHR